MVRAKFVSGLGMFVTLCSGAAQAQPTLSLTEAVRQALASHPLLGAEAERVNSARAQVEQAGLRPNPRLFIQSENWNVSGAPAQPIASTFTDQFLYAAQVLETGGKRQRRVDLAQSTVVIADLDRVVLSRQIAARVKLSYWAAAGTQRVLDLLRESQQNFAQTIEFHEIQLQEGAIAEADVIRIRLEGDRVAVAVENAVRDAEAARIALLRDMGRHDFPELRLTDAVDLQPDPPIFDAEQAISDHPAIRRAREAVEQARASSHLQQALARPDVEILSGYKRTVGFNTFLWGVQVALPFFNKNQGNIQSAQSDLRSTELRLTAAQNAVRAEIQMAYRDVQNRRDRLASLISGSLDRADQSVTIARAAYREGGTDLLRLLDAERVHLEMELQSARLHAEYRQSLVLLETALGVEP